MFSLSFFYLIIFIFFFFFLQQMWTSVSHLRATMAPPVSTWRTVTSASAPTAGKVTLVSKVRFYSI